MAEHLDYLQDLGVDALYLNPIFQSTANHRYITTDYYQVDPLLGGNAAFRTFLNAAHRRGMRVILDGVFNHTSRGFFQFAHILENGPQSPYEDWYHIKGYPLHAYGSNRPPNYACWWNLRELPKLNTDNPAVREYLWGVGRYWVEQGIDGWRLDVPGEIDDDAFWQEFRRRVKAANPEAYLLGEIWTKAQRWCQGDQFDAVMNYVLGSACLGFFVDGGPDAATIAGTGYSHVPALDAPAFGQAIDDLLACLPAGHHPEPVQPHRQPRHRPPADHGAQRRVGGAPVPALPVHLPRRALHLLRRRDRHGGRQGPGLPRRLPLGTEPLAPRAAGLRQALHRPAPRPPGAARRQLHRVCRPRPASTPLDAAWARRPWWWPSTSAMAAGRWRCRWRPTWPRGPCGRTSGGRARRGWRAAG